MAGNASNGTPVAVMGSSAADLDSVVGCLAYAYLLHAETGAGSRVLPFVPIPREDLHLRPEAVLLFEKTETHHEDLIFADEVDLVALLEVEQGRLVLVDTQGQELDPGLRERVIEVVDHHAATAPAPKLERWIVEPVGSACTLVGEQILQRKPEILDPKLAMLLLGAVLLDTVNLDPNAGRATAKDVEIVRRLMEIVGEGSSIEYNELVRARTSVEGLTSNQLLRKDYKEGRVGSLRFGMSSVPLLFDSWRQRDVLLEEAFQDFLEERGLDLLVVLLYQQDQVFRRQLIVCASDVRFVRRLLSYLQTQPLGLQEIPGGISAAQGNAAGRTVWTRCFIQGETALSRKQLEPIVREFLRTDER